MKAFIYIPASFEAASCVLMRVSRRPLARLRKQTFLRAWHSIAYLHPGLHPDGWDVASSGWRRDLKHFAAEAWRRASKGRLAEEELYPSDAQWCGLFDRMSAPSAELRARRARLARRSNA